jgi:hypothetical protein
LNRRGALTSRKKRATHGSPSAPSRAAKADRLAGGGSGGQIPPSAPVNIRAEAVAKVAAIRTDPNHPYWSSREHDQVHAEVSRLFRAGFD